MAININDSRVSCSTGPEFAFMKELPKDVRTEVFFRCAFTGFLNLQALSLTDKSFYEEITKFMEQFDLKVVCPNLQIVDATALKCLVDDEPNVNKYPVIDGYNALKSSAMRDGHKIMLLTVCKGSNAKNLFLKTMSGSGVVSPQRLSQICGGLPSDVVSQTYRVLILSGVPSENANKKYGEQCDMAAEKGCTLPTLTELMTLCVYDGTRTCLRRPVLRGTQEINGCVLPVGKMEPTTVCTSSTDQWGRIWCIGADESQGKFTVVSTSIANYNKAMGTGSIPVYRWT